MSGAVPPAQPVHRPLELTFEGDGILPADRTPLTVTFEHAEAGTWVIPGFWDGGHTYRVRFAPDVAGEWAWRSESESAALTGVEGSFVAEASTERGPVRVASRFHFAHADGTPFRPVGTTAYNWLHQEEPLFTDTVASAAEAGFSKLRFMVFPQAGGYVSHYPELLPFERDADGWDVSRPVPAFFQRLDRAVQTLDARGIQADVLIFTSYDNGRFGLDELTEEQDAAYLRYLVARLSAYPNVWWSLCNEFDLLQRPLERWDRMGALLAEVDPHDHLRSIHNWVELFDHNRPWVTHASIQNGAVTEELGRAGLFRDAYRKPVVLDEIKYEGDIPERWGHLHARELVHRFWVTTASGCYASHGESFVTDSGSLHVVEGGLLRGEAPPRLRFLREILDGLLVPGLDPVDAMDDPAFVVGVPRLQYLQYLGRSAWGAWSFRLPQGHSGERLRRGDAYTVDVIDTWAMTVTRADRVFTLDDVQRNDAYDRSSSSVALTPGSALALLITRVR
jgi:hypothetical protein